MELRSSPNRLSQNSIGTRWGWRSSSSLKKVSECRRSYCGDLISVQLRFYLRNTVDSTTLESRLLFGSKGHHKD